MPHFQDTRPLPFESVESVLERYARRGAYRIVSECGRVSSVVLSVPEKRWADRGELVPSVGTYVIPSVGRHWGVRVDPAGDVRVTLSRDGGKVRR